MNHPTCHRETEEKCPTRDDKGEAICTMGVTSFPVWAGEAFMSYGIAITPDGAVVDRLSKTHRLFLVMIAKRGGHMAFDESRVDVITVKHLSDLVNNGAVVRLSLLSGDRYEYALTSKGTNLVSLIVKAEPDIFSEVP